MFGPTRSIHEYQAPDHAFLPPTPSESVVSCVRFASFFSRMFTMSSKEVTPSLFIPKPLILDSILYRGQHAMESQAQQGGLQWRGR